MRMTDVTSDGAPESTRNSLPSSATFHIVQGTQEPALWYKSGSALMAVISTNPTCPSHSVSSTSRCSRPRKRTCEYPRGLSSVALWLIFEPRLYLDRAAFTLTRLQPTHFCAPCRHYTPKHPESGVYAQVVCI